MNDNERWIVTYQQVRRWHDITSSATYCLGYPFTFTHSFVPYQTSRWHLRFIYLNHWTPDAWEISINFYPSQICFFTWMSCECIIACTRTVNSTNTNFQYSPRLIRVSHSNIATNGMSDLFSKFHEAPSHLWLIKCKTWCTLAHWDPASWKVIVQSNLLVKFSGDWKSESQMPLRKDREPTSKVKRCTTITPYAPIPRKMSHTHSTITGP